MNLIISNIYLDNLKTISGLAERTKRSIKTKLIKLMSDDESLSQWDMLLGDVEFCINIQKQASTKYTPFFLMFGRQPRTPFEVCEF